MYIFIQSLTLLVVSPGAFSVDNIIATIYVIYIFYNICILTLNILTLYIW